MQIFRRKKQFFKKSLTKFVKNFDYNQMKNQLKMDRISLKKIIFQKSSKIQYKSCENINS